MISLHRRQSRAHGNDLAAQMADAQMGDLAYNANPKYFLDSTECRIAQTSKGWRSEMWIRQQWKRGFLEGTKEHWNALLPGLL